MAKNNCGGDGVKGIFDALRTNQKEAGAPNNPRNMTLQPNCCANTTYATPCSAEPDALGENGVVELTGLVGTYVTFGALIKVSQVRVNSTSKDAPNIYLLRRELTPFPKARKAP